MMATANDATNKHCVSCAKFVSIRCVLIGEEGEQMMMMMVMVIKERKNSNNADL